MRSSPATSEDDWKHEWATRVDQYWEQYGVAVEDRVAGPTPGADAEFAYRQLQNVALASGMTAVGEVMDKGLDRWFMDESRRNLEATLEGLSSTLSLMRGYVSSLHPDIYMQGAIDQSSVMTKTEEMAAYLAILPSGGSTFSHFVVVDGVTERAGVKVVAIRDPHGVQYFSALSTFERNFSGDVVVPRGVQK
ncbi:hypothetical protein JAK72_19080 [Stenotrophomonas maltophilia]|nr:MULTISPECIES: hypothetical protein [Stenotrophomonas]MCF3467115.1 hypothetical protein [Stenotrophomonas maltophilia]MCF3491002.1 hypothetical protein [Stenotrophomonas maltophilia]MCF3511712.1 hypothetical protein [Stenotrophomonas maltophilia]MCU1040269.1 hypothetical protein [Stenotrophomonas maltophilia]MCU1055363.1 hypothetical protein [Stenotrophomonas maltophilia]